MWTFERRVRWTFERKKSGRLSACYFGGYLYSILNYVTYSKVSCGTFDRRNKYIRYHPSIYMFYRKYLNGDLSREVYTRQLGYKIYIKPEHIYEINIHTIRVLSLIASVFTKSTTIVCFITFF